ncbi:glucokinase [uncultured Desulfobulbus sp.]|uniref:glucokinase n=1 Tax=uncultured Desulfobulbus sp. TaxID=239745 RepID=UPI0029C85B28|nr:glucokinase [uncultured Desulfobulbus sp.]
MKDGLLLAGDIGATKTTLALYEAAAWPSAPLRQQTLQNAGFADFDSLLREFLGAEKPAPATVCLGVAGPVMANAVKMTNLNWSINAAGLQAHFGFDQAHLINDLVATAMGALHLPPKDLQCLNPGKKQDGAAMAVLAPGSGLGEAFVLPHNETYFPYPSEGGHASFSPRNAEQIALLTFMLKRHAHVSVEQVCSGLVIPDLLAFMATRQSMPDWLRAELEQVTDRTPIIVQAALASVRGEKPCDIAVSTLSLFIDILADEAANLALKTLALGGVFLGGGLAPRLLPLIDPHRFMTVFARGTYQDMLARIPIHIIRNPQTALLGAAAYGAEAMARSRAAQGPREKAMMPQR